MEKKLWEKILKILPDSELINLVKQTKIPIPPGFRIDSIHRNINIIRPRLIQNTLKDLSFFKSILYFEVKVSENEECEKIRGKKREVILAEMKEVENPYLFIISLITSLEEEDQKNGEFLLNEYENLKNKQSINGKSLVVEEKENTNPKKTEELQKELEKKNKKIQQLEQNLANIKNSFNQEFSKWTKEKKKLQTENNEIKKEAQEKETLIEKMQKELEQMQETLSSFQTAVSTNQIIQEEVETEEEEKNLPRVALIGKEVLLPFLEQYDVTIIQSNEIDQFIHHHDYGEIWILTFEMTRLQLFKLRTNLHAQRVIEFHTIKELEKYINQERRVSI